jgi:hypothetical protein
MQLDNRRRELPCSYPCQGANQAYTLAYPSTKIDKGMQTAMFCSHHHRGAARTGPRTTTYAEGFPCLSSLLSVRHEQDAIGRALSSLHLPQQ